MQIVTPQRQTSDYSLPKLAMTLTTAGAQQIPYSPGVPAKPYCETINHKVLTNCNINCSVSQATEYIIKQNMQSTLRNPKMHFDMYILGGRMVAKQMDSIYITTM